MTNTKTLFGLSEKGENRMFMGLVAIGIALFLFGVSGLGGYYGLVPFIGYIAFLSCGGFLILLSENQNSSIVEKRKEEIK